MSTTAPIKVPLYCSKLKWTTGNGHKIAECLPEDSLKTLEEQRLANQRFLKIKHADRPPKYVSGMSRIDHAKLSIPIAVIAATGAIPTAHRPAEVHGGIEGRNVDPPARTPFHLQLDEGTGNTVFIVGSSKQGKSTLLMHIYDKYYAREKDLISILWTANPHIPLYKHHDKLIVSGVWNKEAEEIIQEEKKIQTKTKNKYQFLNMFDDVINVRNNVLMDNLVMTYRNAKMSSIISLQYSNLMSKCCRANVNGICAFGFNTDEAILVIIKTFLSGFLRKLGVRDETDQINFYREATKDHSFIYIQPSAGIISFHRI